MIDGFSAPTKISSIEDGSVSWKCLIADLVWALVGSRLIEHRRVVASLAVISKLLTCRY